MDLVNQLVLWYSQLTLYHIVHIVYTCILFVLLLFIYSRTLAPVAIVICWLYPTQNKFYLILSYLILNNLINTVCINASDSIV